jgi:predicted oxidoreductase (fatty acid repression mutant protein)
LCFSRFQKSRINQIPHYIQIHLFIATSHLFKATLKHQFANMSAPVSTDQWLAAAKYRRTVYGLKGTSAVSDKRVEQIVSEVLSFAPSSYNTQPVRITLVTGEKHKQLWDVIIKTAEPILKGAGEGVWATLSGIFESHKASYGSVGITHFDETILFKSTFQY